MNRPDRPVWRWTLCALALAAAAVGPPTCTPQARAEPPPKFAIEIAGGRNLGLTPYVDDVVYRRSGSQFGNVGEAFRTDQPFCPYLADERPRWGTGFEARFIARSVVAGLSLRWFQVDRFRVHHRGAVRGETCPGPGDTRLPQTRIRPDGTVDDAGVSYEATDSRGEKVDPTTLFVAGLGGGYRFHVFETTGVSLFVPLRGDLLLTRLSRPAAPFRPGLELETGVGARFDFVSVMSLVASARMHGLVTPDYWGRTDSARRASSTDRSTERALFSTALYTSFNVGVQFSIR